MDIIKNILSNTVAFSIIVIILQSILAPKITYWWGIYIVPTLTLVIGEILVWTKNGSHNQLSGTFVVLFLSMLLLVMGAVSKFENRNKKQNMIGKNDFYDKD